MTTFPETYRYLSPCCDPWFWHWDIESEDLAADVVVWTDGSTIAFRPEIRAVLEALAPEGLPPFDAVVLMLAACRDSWQHCHGQLTTLAPDHREPLNTLIEQLCIVNALPASLRASLEAKVILAGVLFEGRTGRGSVAQATRILEGFDQFDPHASSGETQFSSRDHLLWIHLKPLSSGLNWVDFPILCLRVQTSLDQLLKAAKLVLPVVDRARSLLAELDKDPEWRGLARLTRSLMAAVSLPQPLSDHDDLPLGGVSDITNRGQLDRILLSELAQDDLMFTARLALNELLYLRRETPPRPQAETRTLLLDCGLRLWGVPRIFATAVALALIATSRKSGDAKVFRAVGDQLLTVDLLSRDGLIEHLGALEPTLHPGQALPAFLAARDAKTQSTTPILVTSADTLHDPQFRDQLQQQAAQGLYLATVTRDGAFRLSWHAEHQRRQVSSAQLDLDEILQADPPLTRRPRQMLDTKLPRIFQAHPFPLRIPYPISQAVSAAAAAPHHLLVVTHDRRLLCFTAHSISPIQLSDSLPPGRICWLGPDGSPELVRAMILAAPHRKPTLLEINVAQGSYRLLEFAEASRRAQCSAVLYQGAVFLIGPSLVQAFTLQGQRINSLKVPQQLRYHPPGRFFQDDFQQDWYALALRGTHICLEQVTCASGIPLPHVVQLVDVAGHDGPFGISHNGDTFDTATGKWHRCQGAAGRLYSFTARCLQQITAMSRDGHYVAAEFRRPALSEHSKRTRTLVRQVESGELALPILSSAKPQVDLEFRSWTRDNDDSMELQRRFGAVPSSAPRFIKATVYANGMIELALQSGRKYTLDWSLTWTTDYSRAVAVGVQYADTARSAYFHAVGASSLVGRRFRLQVAEFPDASRIYVDSRGLLHLVSAVEELDEITLVSPTSHQEVLTGWCSDGTWFGNPCFHYATVKNTCSTRSVFDRVIDPFMQHITRVICLPGP